MTIFPSADICHTRTFKSDSATIAMILALFPRTLVTIAVWIDLLSILTMSFVVFEWTFIIAAIRPIVASIIKIIFLEGANVFVSSTTDPIAFSMPQSILPFTLVFLAPSRFLNCNNFKNGQIFLGFGKHTTPRVCGLSISIPFTKGKFANVT